MTAQDDGSGGKKGASSKQARAQNRKKGRMMTIWDLSSAAPAPDPGDPGGSSTATGLDEHAAPEPRPGDPGRDMTATGQDEPKGIKKKKEGILKRLLRRLRAAMRRHRTVGSRRENESGTLP